MEKENKDLQGQKPQENLNVEEKMKEEVSAKIAEAASEIQDDINAAGEVAAVEFDANAENPQSDEEDKVQEPKKVTMRLGAFIASLAGCLALGLLIMFIGFKAPGWAAQIPEGETAIKVDGETITDQDMTYYIYQAASKYYTENTPDQTGSMMNTYDWDQTAEDGRKVSDIIKENAINDAIGNTIAIQKSMENGVEWTEQEENYISTSVDGFVQQYGEEGFAQRTRAMGIPTAKQYKRTYIQMMQYSNASKDIEDDIAKYCPEDVSVLNDYIDSDSASVKHILIKTESDANAEQGAEAPDPAAKLQVAQQVLDKVNGGEDFDALMDEFNEDTGEGENGYTFTSGEMMPEFEAASFALKMDEVSDIVTTSYGYHIIKRIPGINELENMWAAEAKIKKNQKILDKMSVSEIMNDVAEAMNSLNTAQVPAA